jgi:UvrD-like helicase C-terminal domain
MACPCLRSRLSSARHQHQRAQPVDQALADVGAIPARRDVFRRRDAIQRVPGVIQTSIAFDLSAAVGKLHRAHCCAGRIPLFSFSAVETYFEGCRGWPSFCFGDHIGAKARRATLRILAVFPRLRPSHGENRASSPLGSASEINDLGALSQGRTGPYGKTATLATSIVSIPPMASSSPTSTVEPSPTGLVSWTCPPTPPRSTKARVRNIQPWVIPIMTQHYAMLQRNLLYTGVTRGKRLVVLVGQKKAVAIAARNVSGRRRWSKLQEWLRPNQYLSRQIGMAS